MGSLNGRSRRLDRASFPRALITAMMAVSLVCGTTPRNAWAQSCDTMEHKAEVPYGQCSCPQTQMATGATCQQWSISRTGEHWGCLFNIPAPKEGNIGCLRKPAEISKRMNCYVGVDMWMFAYCAGAQAGCTAALIGVSKACIPIPTAAISCPTAVAIYVGCQAGLAGACLAPCSLNKCYADLKSEKAENVRVYDRFSGGKCVGSGPSVPPQGGGG